MRTLLLLLALIVGVTCESQPLSSVRLANGEWPPYLSEQLPFYGSVSHIVTAAFASQGIGVQYQFFPWDRAYQEARSGRLDGTLAWVRTPERAVDFLFSDGITTTDTVLFHLRSHPIKWKQLSDLSSLRFGGVLGYTYGPQFDEMERRGALKVERIPADAPNFRKLMLGRIDVFPIDREIGLFILATQMPDIAPFITYDPRPIFSARLRLMISKKAPNGAQLVQKFNAGLTALRGQGLVDQYMLDGRVSPAVSGSAGTGQKSIPGAFKTLPQR